MLRFQLFEGMNKKERAAIGVSAFLILLCLLAINFFELDGGDDKSARQLGYISEVSNDIRHKNGGKVFWHTAKKNQSIKSGDKVFTGKQSSAKIVLKDNSSFQLAESSLVEFKDYKKEKIADFSMGNFTLSVKGSIKVMIGGKVAEIKGEDSQVKLVVDKQKKITFQVIKGETDISYEKKSYSLNEKNPVAKLVKPRDVAAAGSENETEFPSDQDPTSEAITLEQPKPPAEPVQFEHILGLYDVYEKNGGQLVYKTQDITLLSKKINLQIAGLLPSDSVYIEHANNRGFTDSKRFHVSADSVYLPQAYIGVNYWRYSPDQQRWSIENRFDVSLATLPNSQPSVRSKPGVPLIDGAAKAKFIVGSPIDTTGYIVEYGDSPEFERGTTRLFWFYHNTVTLTLNKTGTYYTRFRAVDKGLRLGDWSDARAIEVFNAPPLKAPRWVKNSYESMVDETIELAWKKQENIEQYNLTVVDAAKNVFYTAPVKGGTLQWAPRRGGTYFATLIAQDKYGRISPRSSQAKITVTTPVINLTERIKKKPKRMLTSTDLTSALAVESLAPNRVYIRSMASVSTAYYTFQSAAQVDTVEEATSPGIIANLLVWFNNHGLEGILQKNLASSETATGSSADIISAEVRYRYRITPAELRLFRSFQTSAYAGYEMYRNADTVYFLEGYDLFKLGAIFDIPIFSSWLIGTHIGYGMGSGTTKFEGSLNLDYFFRRNWSMGAGYHINLLQQQNPAQFQTFSVFREGYTDGVFHLKYFF